MKHFLSISQLSVAQASAYIERAQHLRSMKVYPSYIGQCMATLFYEHSTRTRVSFELAAKHLGMTVITMDSQSSSEHKGEDTQDTLRTLEALGINFAVVRHKNEAILSHFSAKLSSLRLINAGEGMQEHPTQALLDMMTIMDHYSTLNDLKIVIVGDIKHSRVAHSFMRLSQLFGVGELVFVAPECWAISQPLYGYYQSDLTSALENANVVMCLRVQKERLQQEELYCLDAYQTNYQITQERLKIAASEVILMHPGPVNRGIELDTTLVDDPRYSVILEQVRNGLFLRMSLLESMILSV